VSVPWTWMQLHKKQRFGNHPMPLNVSSRFAVSSTNLRPATNNHDQRRPSLRSASVALLLAGALTAIAAVAVDASQFVVDSAGRRVEIPDHIARVQPAGPPATVLIYALAPEKLVGWVRKPREAELAYLSPVVRNLPLGRTSRRWSRWYRDSRRSPAPSTR
jgi:hypothetical protein